MSQGELNKRIRDKVSDYPSEVDHDLLWDSIAGRVPKKKKKKRGAFFLWGAVGLAVLVLLVYSLQPDAISKTAIAQQESHGRENTRIETESRSKTTGSGIPANSVVTSGMLNVKPLFTKERDSKPSQQIVIPPSKANVLGPTSDTSTANSMQPSFENTHDQTQPSISSNHMTTNKEVSNLESLTTSQTMAIARDNIQAPYSITAKTATLASTSHPLAFNTSSPAKPPRTRPNKKHRQFIELGYTFGKLSSAKTISIDQPILDDGKPSFSQGVGLKYGRFASKNLYITGVVRYDINYNHFQATIQRDTVVPSSQGEQTLAINQYADGRIDNISGIPMVNATSQRSISKLNTYQSLDLGLGIGYIIKMKGIRLLLEGQVTKSMHFRRAGLYTVGDEQQVVSLATSTAPYSNSGAYRGALGLTADFPISNRVNIFAGAQYRVDLSNQIADTRGSEYYRMLGGQLGVRHYF